MHHYPERDDDDELFETWGNKSAHRRNPPLVAGGQGRSARDVTHDGYGCAMLLAVGAWALVFWVLVDVVNALFG